MSAGLLAERADRTEFPSDTMQLIPDAQLFKKTTMPRKAAVMTFGHNASTDFRQLFADVFLVIPNIVTYHDK